MRYHTHELDGIKTQIAWDKDDYLAAISDLESHITQRRLRDAVTSEEGARWLRGIEDEIAELRSELALI